MTPQDIFNQLEKDFDWNYIYECKIKLNIVTEKTRQKDIEQMKQDILLLIQKTIQRKRPCEYRNFASIYDNGNIAIMFHIQKTLFLNE